MNISNDLISISVNIDITAASLQAIVENAKSVTGADEKGIYHVDTADWTGRVISDFLKKNNFEAYAKNLHTDHEE